MHIQDATESQKAKYHPVPLWEHTSPEGKAREVTTPTSRTMVKEFSGDRQGEPGLSCLPVGKVLAELSRMG